MTDQLFAFIWLVSFILYFTIYTLWIPLKTQQRIESWLMSDESNETLLSSLEVITTKIREQLLVDFEEFMLPQARDSFKNFWNGAMGNAAQELSKTDEGAQLSIMHGMANELKDQPWYVQAAASKLLPLINKAAESKGDPMQTPLKGLGLTK
jgi:hypothetical protein